eukprot:TRINITY_DN4781_c0_g2_i6.p1 TRINITY_DN4781_c0_g2~~TRINITY_DN4781_c0_g2_i6.p1  ORF type:complete len:138 (+),score=46.44 TRINITY_DN4781_c0_g2_i6:349-762(+)
MSGGGAVKESGAKAKSVTDELLLVKGRPRLGSEFVKPSEELDIKKGMNSSFVDTFDVPLLEQEEEKTPLTHAEREAVPESGQEGLTVILEDHGKGHYSLGHMQVKMKSNSQWTELYANILKGCLLFYKSFSVVLLLC